MAAVLACHPALASHTAAGWLWGLLRSAPDTIHITVPTSRRSKPDFVTHFADLPDVDIAEVDGIPVTALPRTYLDLAAMWRMERLEKALERAEELGLFDLGPVEELLARCGSHPGRRRLDRVLATYRPDPRVMRSGLEKLFLKYAREAGLPLPSMNYAAAGFELDAYWPEVRFGVELEVYETHGTRAAYERDHERQEKLMLEGIEMIRVTGARLEREPRVVMERIASHLERRRRELGLAVGGAL